VRARSASSKRHGKRAMQHASKRAGYEACGVEAALSSARIVKYPRAALRRHREVQPPSRFGQAHAGGEMRRARPDTGPADTLPRARKPSLRPSIRGTRSSACQAPGREARYINREAKRSRIPSPISCFTDQIGKIMTAEGCRSKNNREKGHGTQEARRRGVLDNLPAAAKTAAPLPKRIEAWGLVARLDSRGVGREVFSAHPGGVATPRRLSSRQHRANLYALTR